MTKMIMTYAGIDALKPGMELNVRVASDVMGGITLMCPPYSESMDEAYAVIKKFIPDVTINYIDDDMRPDYPTGWHCCLHDKDGNRYHSRGCGTPAEAVCKAALMVAHRVRT